MRKPVHEFMKFENIKDMLQKTGENMAKGQLINLKQKSQMNLK